jgi:DNA-binding transcriptional regulator GbsR (MarR family)
LNPTLESARQTLIEALSRISQFWGYPRAMGAIYGALYLSPSPLSLDELVEQVGVTKGAVSTNVRALERLNMVHRHVRLGERKDYYSAETDFWKIVKGVLKEREQSEFDQALRAVGESLAQVKAFQAGGQSEMDQAEMAVFYAERLRAMQSFFNTLDHLVGTVLALEELRLGTLERLLGGMRKEE